LDDEERPAVSDASERRGEWGRRALTDAGFLFAHR
jgi:hypothetical protein